MACEPTHISSSVMHAAVDANFLFLSPEKKSVDCQSTLFLSLPNILFIPSLIVLQHRNTKKKKSHIHWLASGLSYPHRLHIVQMPTAKKRMLGRFDCILQVTPVPSKGVRCITRKKAFGHIIVQNHQMQSRQGHEHDHLILESCCNMGFSVCGLLKVMSQIFFIL